MKRLSNGIASRLGARSLKQWESGTDPNAVAAAENVIFTSRARVVKSSWFTVLREGVLSLTADRLVFILNGVKLDAPVAQISDVQSQWSRQRQGFTFKVAGVAYMCSLDRLSSPSVDGSALHAGTLPPSIGEAIRVTGTRTEVFSAHALSAIWLYLLSEATGNPANE